ncbi:pentapeptide repeat-containing protein [Hydrogenoanaerobacterium sp.]|uniref:pentapeptide repeat-containing protein n=1 Tax=Hydrogenoanaerobacterium sp. TaxID=2953763 RepID=UPI0028A0DBD2|nr:pentapeptide repeat-containing protein [Hydrogenoanaerobacterium sp.]
MYYAKAEGFPADKAAGKPCKSLMPDFRCSIHPKLMACKLKGCMAYDCFGAGQKVAQAIYSGANWMTTPEIADQMFKVFLQVWQLHQMLWYLVEASTLIPAEKLKNEIDALILENEQMTRLNPDEILALDIQDYRSRVNTILKKAGELVRTAINSTADNRISGDYIGKNFKHANFNGKDFSMTLLIAVNLEGCSLHGTNFLGADMRDTNIKNTDLSESVFLTQGQVNAAKGNRNTKLPETLAYPISWQRL